MPVSCLVELPPSRLLSPVDEMFVESLKVAMKANPSADVAPIVGLVVLEEGQCFQESKKESYQYETLGGNNSRTALQALMKEDDNPIFRSRLVSVYQGLSDEAALRLAAKHNLATSLHHEMTTWEKVRMYRALLFSLTGRAEDDSSVPEKPKKWRDYCASILMQPVRALDDACMFFLAGLPKETFSVAEQVFDLYSMGEIKGQTAKRGSLGKKLDLKGSNFKHARGLNVTVVHELLCEVAANEKSVAEMTAECIKVKRL